MGITNRLRYEILKRDNHRCRYCGATADEARLAVDHVMPVALGGSDLPENLVAACVICNAGKSSSAPGGALEDGPAEEAVEASRERREKEQAVAHREAVRAAILNRYVAAFSRGWGNCAPVYEHDWRAELDFLIDFEVPEHIVQARAYEAAITPDPAGGPFDHFRRLVRVGMAREAQSAPVAAPRGGGYDRPPAGYGLVGEDDASY